MADVQVSNWGQLVDAITSTATENKEIYLTDNIDMNEQLPTGVTTSVKRPSNSYVYTVHGNGKKISKLFCRSNIVVFEGSSNAKRLIFDNVIFDDFLIEYAGSNTALTKYATFNNCTISCTLVDCSFRSTSVVFHNCGITITGRGTGSASISGSSSDEFENCNIKLLGEFKDIAMSLRNSYLGGEFRQVGASTSTTSFAFGDSFCSMIDADIQADRLPTESSGITLLLVNSDKFHCTSQFPSDTKYTLVSNADMANVSALQALGYPAR